VLGQATGGQLLERIGTRKHYSEMEAARYFFQVRKSVVVGENTTEREREI
jgi:hypothetical protein